MAIMRQYDPPGVLVFGDAMVYQVWFSEEGVHCDCMAGCDSLLPVCSHAVAAMVAMAEFLEG